MSNAIDPAQASAFSEDRDPPILSDRKFVSGRAFLVDILLMATWVVAVDWLLYQIGTHLAWGVWLLTVVSFLAILRLRTRNFRSSTWVSLIILLIGLKLIWCGSALQITCGLFLVICNAMALSGFAPFLPEAFAFMAYMCVGATSRLRSYRVLPPTGDGVDVRPNLSFILPIVVVGCFATLFVLANPDVASSVMRQLQAAFDSIGRLLGNFHVAEGILWLFSGFAFLGLLYPARAYLFPERKPAEFGRTPEMAKVYPAFRNTLLSVIGLFAVYLLFEFTTLWFREFPENFYYAGYAHQGAFWLTVALALATVVLSAIFRGQVLADNRLAFLKRLALIWSIENLLLSAAVYNRLLIYIDFNGMTQMRVIGLLGITSVVAGFALVVIKLTFDRGFIWLIHRQLWVPVFAVVIYAILPVDWLVNRFNVYQVEKGNLAPSVQIVAQQVSSEGILPLVRLVDCEDTKIRDGVRAILALWAEDMASDRRSDYMRVYSGIYRGNWQSKYGHQTPWLMVESGFTRTDPISSAPWHRFQMANYILANELKRIEPKLAEYKLVPKARDEAIDAFFEYAYKWY